MPSIPKLQILVLVLAVTAFTACGNDDIAIEGEYTSTAVWDLSAPFGRDGIGGAFADLLIEEAVSTAVPGLIEDEAIDLTSTLIRAPIKGVVESRLPDELKEGGEVLVGLRDLLENVDVETTLTFTDDVEGHEVMTKLVVPFDGGRHELDSSLLPAGITVGGDIEGDREERDRVKLEPYDLSVYYGELILILVGRVLERDAAALTAETSAAIPCAAVVEEITGGSGSFDFEVAGQSISISAGALDSACNAVKTALEQYALGLARLDSGVQLGGMVSLVDANGDGLADELRSEADFEGRITLLPGPFEPKFTSTFQATRR